MKRNDSSRTVAAAVGCTFALVAPAALADITLHEKMSVQGAGFMSFANMSGTSTTVIAGDRARTHSELQFESRLARMFARDAGRSTEIIRLDRRTLYQLDIDKREYSEVSLDEWREQLQQAMEQSREAQQQQPMPVDESSCDWSEPVTEVTRGERAVIAGYDTEQLTITASQSCADRETGQVCDFALSLEQWLAPGFDNEAAAFMQAWAQELGVDVTGSGDFAQRAEAFLGRYHGLWSEVAEQVGDVDGYALKSAFALSIGGAQCDIGGQRDGQRGVTAADVGGAVGGVAGRVAGSLLGRRRQQEPEPVAVDAPAMTRLFTVTTELVSASPDPVDPATFEVPADYTRVSPGN